MAKKFISFFLERKENFQKKKFEKESFFRKKIGFPRPKNRTKIAPFFLFVENSFLFCEK
jgi:predicted nucleotide-binding protein (sugar kinase/HSP70/actin superfamily)